MKLVMTLLARDEEDVIESHIDFHLSRGVDHIYAMDNLSQDGTTDILRSYERAGLLTYLHQGGEDHSQGVWVTDMARRAYLEQGADWVINSDADEFWWPQDGDLKTVLAAIPTGVQALRVERTNFIPVRGAEGRHFAAAMTIRHRRSLNTLGQPLPPKVCHRGLADVIVEQGNHHASRPGAALEITPAPITILHYPVRTYAQFSHKIAIGGAAYKRNTTLPQSSGETWRRLHEQQLRGEFQAVFDSMVLDDDAIAEGLASGDLIRDERLRDALADLAVRADPAGDRA